MLFQKNPDLVWGLISSMYIGNFLLLLIQYLLNPCLVSLLRLPYTIIMGSLSSLLLWCVQRQ